MRLTRLDRQMLGATGLIALVIGVLSLPTAAVAGVHVDPGGPAGKQYSDTLDKARVDNSNGNPAAAVPGSEAEAPLFGEGVEPADAKQPGARNKGGGDEGDGGGAASSFSDGSSNGGGSAAGLLLLVIGGVAVVGAGAGFGIHRLSQPSA